MAFMRYQPQGVVKPRGGYTAVGAVFANNNTEVFGSGAEVKLIGSPAQTVQPYGLARKFSVANNSYATITQPPGVIDLTVGVPFAIVMVFTIDTLGVTTRMLSYRHIPTSLGIQIGYSTTNRLGLYHGASTGEVPKISTSSSTVLEVGKPYVLVCGWDNGYFMLLNGVRQNGTTGTNFATSNPASTDINIGRRNSGGSNFDGSIALFAHVKGSVDAMGLSVNPWQLFEAAEEPYERRLAATVTYANTSGASTGVASTSAVARAVADAYGTSTPAAVANATIQSVRNTAGSASSAATTGSATQAIQNIKGEASSATTSSGSSQTVQNVSGAASASAATSATMRSVFQVVGASQGAAIATAPAFSITQTVGSANGTASVSGNVVSVACTSGGSTGSATVSGNAACVWQVVGNANGTATVTAVSSFESGGGTVFIDTVGASYGSATSDAVARAIANINGNALGSSLGTSQAQTLTNAIGAALSSSMAAGTGATVVTTTGTAVAQAQTQAQVFTVKNSAGQATGTSSTQSVAITIYDTVAASLSVSEVQAVAQAIVNATGRSAGVSTVSGMTNGGVHYIATGDQFNVTIVFSPYVVTLEEKPISIRLEPKKYGVNIN